MRQQLLGLVMEPTPTFVSTSWCGTATKPRRRSTCPRYKAGWGPESILVWVVVLGTSWGKGVACFKELLGNTIDFAALRDLGH